MNMGVFSSVAVADEVAPRPTENIVAKCEDDIWDGTDKDTRQQVPHDSLDGLDEDARIFTEKGFEIFRHLPYYKDHQQKPCGVLVDFRNLDMLFDSDVYLRYARAGLCQPSYSAYPQAGLVTAGHIQAKSLVSDFYPLIESINVDILRARGEDFEEELLAEAPRWPVYGISCQIYNAVMHSTRGTGQQHHAVACGKVSGALGGKCVPKTASILEGQTTGLLQSCKSRLPHKAYEIKASNPKICKDLRVENVYWVDFDQVAEENRSGR